MREFCRVFPGNTVMPSLQVWLPPVEQSSYNARQRCFRSGHKEGMVGNLWRDPALVMLVNVSALRGYDHLQNLHLLFAVGDRGFLACTRRSDF